MKTIAYTRVSTSLQASDGVSLEMQESKIRAYCKLNDLNLSEVICDAGISGKNLLRPGIKRLMSLIQAGGVDSIAIYSLSRLGRSTSDLLEMARLLDKKNIAIHSLTEKLDTTSAIGRFFFILTSGLAEMERGLISERTKAALAEKRSKNERINFKAPFGYEFTADGKVVENPHEQSILQIVSELKSQGESIRNIQRRLTKDGYLNRNGRPFAVSAVHYMLKKAA